MINREQRYLRAQKQAETEGERERERKRKREREKRGRLKRGAAAEGRGMKACTADVESGEEKKGRSRKEHRGGKRGR